MGTYVVKRPGREGDYHSPPTNVEAMNDRHCASTPTYVCIAWCLAKHQEDFTVIDNILTVYDLKNVFASLSECRKNP
jgi:hypothetical protein